MARIPFVLFVFALGQHAASASSTNAYAKDSEVPLIERLNRLDKEVQELKREKELWEREKELFTTLTTECANSKQQWEADRQTLNEDVTLLKQNLDTLLASIGSGPGSEGTVLETLSSPKAKTKSLKRSLKVARADDTNPLEIAVNQLSQRVTAVSADLQALQNTHNTNIQELRTANTQQDKAIQEAGSSTYVRWGKSSCPSTSTLVYAGVVGGSYYTHSGTAPNELCLTMSPVLSDRTPPHAYAYLYGTEYFTNDGYEAEDTVCAVCRVSRPTVIMIAGTNTCESGWTKEYSGFLLAGGHHNQGGADYVCVDYALEGRPGGHSQVYGSLLYYTLTQCGSLPCGPYVNNKIVTCVVCSK